MKLIETINTKISEEQRREFSDLVWVIILYLMVLLLVSLVGALPVWPGEPPEPLWIRDDHPMVVARTIATSPSNWFTNLFVNNWYRWDTGWYLKIAALGYDANDHSVGFQPLYPLVIRMVKNILGISYIGSAILVSRVSCLITLILLYKITKNQFNSRTVAQKTTFLLLVFPSAFFLFVGYTEALYLALALSSWYLFMHKKWFWAGLTGGLSSLARIQGIVLTVPLVWMFLSSVYDICWDDLINSFGSFYRSLKKQTKAYFKSMSTFVPLFVAVMPTLSVIIYSSYLRINGMNSITGAYSNWGTKLLWPWEGLWQLTQRTFTTNLNFIDAIEIPLFIILITAIVLSFRTLPIPYSLYNLAMFIFLLMVGRESNFLPGFMRYMLIIFPIFMVLGNKIKKTWLFNSVVFLSMSVNLLMTWLFVNWFWIA
jgi:Gpi18-like mannosyltransferase